ncbi:hypothetical protein ACS0TY_017192 [Phlomoides rotata]
MEESVTHHDRLSELPLSLIHHILSFLPLRDVVSTTLLSKGWVNLWTTAPCLNLCETTRTEEGENDVYMNRTKTQRFQNFVNRALVLWKGIKILKFKIDIILDFDLSLVRDLHVWTLFAVKNEVEELEIITSPEYLAPQCLYSCSSIRKLTLVGCNVQFHGSPSWNMLKSLRMRSYFEYDSEGLINRILLGSPELEVFELQLMDTYENLNIGSRSLKKLKIENYVYFDEDEPSLYTLRICCPNLETLEISGLFGKCLFTDVSSLIDATLHLDTIYKCNDVRKSACLKELLGETLEQVFSTIQHVEKVALSDLCVQAFGASRKKHLISPLPNVKFLELDVCRIKLGDMMDLLGIFPNLKMLVIEQEAFTKPPDFNTVNCMEFGTNLSRSFLRQLKVVEISARLPDFSIFEFIEFLLKHAIMLEKLVLRSRGITSSQHKSFSKKLLSMPRSSPTAKVILKIESSGKSY